jgi:membrane protein DedA with SNARE-associated domain
MALIEILRPLAEFITSVISSLGYGGIFILMILESALIPIPSEIIMPFSGFLVSSGKLGSVGVILAFLIKYGKYILFRVHHLVWTEQLFQKYGDKISFVGRLLPVVRTYISLPAGIGKSNFIKFVVYTLVGSIIWNSLLTYGGIQLGRSWQHIDKYSGYLDIIAVVATAVFIVWIVYNNTKNRRKGNITDNN